MIYVMFLIVKYAWNLCFQFSESLDALWFIEHGKYLGKKTICDHLKLVEIWFMLLISCWQTSWCWQNAIWCSKRVCFRIQCKKKSNVKFVFGFWLTSTLTHVRLIQEFHFNLCLPLKIHSCQRWLTQSLEEKKIMRGFGEIGREYKPNAHTHTHIQTEMSTLNHQTVKWWEIDHLSIKSYSESRLIFLISTCQIT